MLTSNVIGSSVYFLVLCGGIESERGRRGHNLRPPPLRVMCDSPLSGSSRVWPTARLALLLGRGIPGLTCPNCIRFPACMGQTSSPFSMSWGSWWKGVGGWLRVQMRQSQNSGRSGLVYVWHNLTTTPSIFPSTHPAWYLTLKKNIKEHVPCFWKLLFLHSGEMGERAHLLNERK